MAGWASAAAGLMLFATFGLQAAADISEGFDAGSSVPAGWIDGGTVNDNVATHYQSAPNCRALGSNDTLQTPMVDYPTNLSFYVDASTAGNGKTAAVDYCIDGGSWIQLGSFTASTAGSTKNFPMTNAPTLSASQSVRFRFNSTFHTWYLDTVVLRTGPPPFSDVPPRVNLDPAETNGIAVLGEEIRVVVGATETDGDEITLRGIDLPAGSTFEPNPLVGTSPLTNAFSWVPPALGIYNMTFLAEDKDGPNQVVLTLYVYATDPILLLSEDFDDSSLVPAGWVDDGTANDADAAHYHSEPNCRALGAGDSLTVPAVDYPTNLSFYVDASTGGNGQTAWVSYRIGSNDWISLGSFVARMAGEMVSFPLKNAPDLSSSAGVQFHFSSTFNTWYLDDVLIRGEWLSDQPPVLEPIGSQVVALSNVLSLVVAATDYDGHEITLSAGNLPPGATFGVATNRGTVTSLLTYTPMEFEVGMVYTSAFYAADIDGTNEEAVAISVFDRLVGFAFAGTEAWEGDGTQRLAVVVSRPGDVTVEVAACGSADPGPDGDYALVETNLVFIADGSVTQFLELVLFDDTDREVPETSILTLTNAVGADIAPTGLHAVDIRDNDAAFFEPLDANPGWSVQGRWAFGKPMGGGGNYGNPDPASGYTGTNVYGYNLSGDYPNNMSTTDYLTTPAIDCSRFRNVRLEFQRWLGVEYSVYDQAVVQASTDRVNWSDVWRHSGQAITDASWTNVAYDLSSLADGQPSVYIRWGMGPTDVGWTYCGWNLDDVSLEGEAIANALFRFAAAGFVARETCAVARVTVERIGLTHVTAEIVFATGNGTATAGADYRAVEETLVFAPGERSRILSIPLHDDLDVEGEETVALYLFPTATGETGAPSVAALTLLDDESPGAALPFFEGFESGSLSSHWSRASTGAGRIRVGSEPAPALDGTNHLCMDSGLYNVFSLNELVLTANLAGQTNVTLDFWEYNFDYELHAMPAQFSGSVNADGVAASTDGLNWRRLFSIPSYDYYRNGYTNRVINLSAFAAGNGLAMDSHFKIKFQQYDCYPLPYRGHCFDNINVYDSSQVADLRLTLQESEDPTTPGSNLVYTLLVTNLGPLAVSNVVVNDRMPDGIVFVSALGSQGSCTQQDGVVACDLGALPRGGAATVSLTVTPLALGVLTNRACVAGDVFDPRRTNDQVVATTVVDEQGGVVQLDMASYAAVEGAGAVYIGVTRTQRTYGAVSVNYATANTSATAGADYQAATGTLVLASGQVAGQIPIVILDDSLDEPEEAFTFSIGDPGGGAVLGSSTSAAIVILDDDGIAAFPFYEPFASGVLSNCWRTYSTANGRIQVTADFSPYAGACHLTMDASAWGINALNELVLTVDLSGQQGVTLVFWHKQFSDQGHIMSSAFAGHQNADGVAMSMNGTNWVKVRGLTQAEGSSNAYGRFEVALDPIAASNGLIYTSAFKVKFQQYGNTPIANDGFAFDEISLYARNGDLRFSQAAYDAAETGGVAMVAVERVNGSLGEVSIAYATSDGSAVAGTDYTAVEGTLVLSNGVTAGFIAIPISDDVDDEPDETANLALSNPTGGALLASPSNAILTILDNDGPGALRFAAGAFTATEEAGAIAIAVLRTGGSEGAVRVNFSATGGTAQAGSDYVATTGTLSLADGVVSQTFTVAILEDSEGEQSETVLLSLSEPEGGASLGQPDAAALTILDNEDPNFTYYQTALGKTGPELRAELHEIINDHTVFDYDTVWTILREIDENPSNSSEVLMVYKYAGRDKFNNGAASGQWNREHVWPLSHGFSGDPVVSRPPSVDVHHLRAADVSVNAVRSNKDFDNGGAQVEGTPPTCRTTDTTFEPPDQSKGDVARMVFYMDVRYEGDRESEPDLQATDSANTSGTQLGRRSTLLQWHFQDPPDAFEIRRNNLIHQNWQRNRNPFIDHPEWVCDLWGGGVPIQTVSGANGTISPTNPQVYYGANQTFLAAPAPYYCVGSLYTNGVGVDADFGQGPFAYVWSNVRAPGSLAVGFAANLASNNTPEWWLAQFGFTNDFDAAALGDQDNDGFRTWEEYRADTVPTNDASYFGIGAAHIPNGPGEIVLRWPSASNRTYAVWMATNLLNGFSESVDGNLAATPPANTYTAGALNANAPSYQIRVSSP